MYLNLQEFNIFTLVSLSQCIARPAGIAKNLTRTARASFHKVFQKREKFSSSSMASTSESLRGSPGVVCCLILAVIREKNEAT